MVSAKGGAIGEMGICVWINRTWFCVVGTKRSSEIGRSRRRFGVPFKRRRRRISTILRLRLTNISRR